MKHSTKKPDHRARSWLKTLAIYAACLAGLEIAGQGVVRYLESKQPTGIEAEDLLSYEEPVLGFGLRKNIERQFPLWTVRTNEWGFRENEFFPREKPAGEVRIFVLGGSTVFGWGVTSDETLPSELHKLISQDPMVMGSGKNVRVINAGVPWYASWHEAALAFFRVLEFNPDWIVVFDGLNDTAMGVSPTWTPLYQGYVDTPTRIAHERRMKKGDDANFLIEALKISPTFSYFYARARLKTQLNTGVYRPEVWDQYLGYMDRLSRLTQSLNVKFSLFYQPVMMVDKPLSHFETSHNGTSMANPAFAETFRRQYLEGERRILENKKLAAFSLKSAFIETTDPIYLDGLHYNRKGHRLLAKEMFEQVMQRQLPEVLSRDARFAATIPPPPAFDDVHNTY